MHRCLGKQGAKQDSGTKQRHMAKAAAHGAAVLLTCSAPPGRKLSNLVPSVLLKIIALHAADRLGCLATDHNHDLQKDK